MSEGPAVVDPVVALLGEVAHRGSTVLPADIARDVLQRRSASSDALQHALDRGLVLVVEWAAAPAYALAQLAEAEELAADGLLQLAAQNRLAVVVGAFEDTRRAAVTAVMGTGTPLVLLDDAHRLGIEQLAEAVEDLPEDAVLVLAIDPALPLAGLPGAVALDLAGSGICPVLRAKDDTEHGSGPERAAVAVAAGRYTGSTADRAVVEVAVATPQEAVRRVGQLVSDSIPRTFAVPAGQVLVLTRERSGPTGVDALATALGRPAYLLTEPPPGRAEVAVVVLGGDHTPDRAELYAALRSGRRHVSLVHPSGLSLADVAAREVTPRRTRLGGLLRP